MFFITIVITIIIVITTIDHDSFFYYSVHGTAPGYLSELCRSNAEDAARCSFSTPIDRQHTAISRFHVRRPTLVMVRLQSPGQHHVTDYQQQSGHLTLQNLNNFFLMDRFFSFHSSRTRAPFNWTACYGGQEINALLFFCPLVLHSQGLRN